MAEASLHTKFMAMRTMVSLLPEADRALLANAVATEGAVGRPGSPAYYAWNRASKAIDEAAALSAAAAAAETPSTGMAIWRCVHCRCVTFISDNNTTHKGECACGAEWYPMSCAIEEGVPMTLADIEGGVIGGRVNEVPG